MRAVDTNLVLRYLVPDDDPPQTVQAARIIDGERVFVPTTVLLETEWVLRTYYGFKRADMAHALAKFSGLKTVQVEHPWRLKRALEWLQHGMDFADALHLASAGRCEAFVTFDKNFVKAASKVPGAVVLQP